MVTGMGTELGKAGGERGRVGERQAGGERGRVGGREGKSTFKLLFLAVKPGGQ